MQALPGSSLANTRHHPVSLAICNRMSSQKWNQLLTLLRSWGSCLVAYSGGVDSALLAVAARRALGDKALAVLADSPSLPRREREEAEALARQFQFPLRVVSTAEFSNPDYTSNPVNRCYFCKHELFSVMQSIAKQEGVAVLAYGENASDAGDFRPGSQAALEFQVRAPLKEVGLTKAEIRELSAGLGLPTADKPQLACLSSRIPHGETVTTAKLGMVEAAEDQLRDMGFRDVRVRHHELTGAGGTSSHPKALARIEAGPCELDHLFQARGQVMKALQHIGYAHVTMDFKPYERAGS